MSESVTSGEPGRDASSGLMVLLEDVHKHFGGVEVLKGIDLEIKRGEVACVLGPSGSGKSTMLRCINHLEKISVGRVTVDGELLGYHERRGRLHEMREREVARQRRQIGMVFQRFNLFPHLSATGNVVCAPRCVAGADAPTAVQEAETLLRRVGLGHRLRAYPSELSGGEQQRVAIARSLAMHPKLMLFDEPTSALDPELVGEVLDVMRDLVKRGMTMIVVTHEVGFAREAADSVVFMDDGQIVERGAPREVLSNPRTERARAFLSKVLA